MPTTHLRAGLFPLQRSLQISHTTKHSITADSFPPIVIYLFCPFVLNAGLSVAIEHRDAVEQTVPCINYSLLVCVHTAYLPVNATDERDQQLSVTSCRVRITSCHTCDEKRTLPERAIYSGQNSGLSYIV